MDSRTPTDREVENMIAELRSILDDLEHGCTVITYDDSGGERSRERTPTIKGLLLMLSAAYKDGYRTSARPVESPTSKVDEQGFPIPPLSDPVGDLVSEPTRVTDPMRFNAATVWRSLSGAVGDLRVARGAMMKALEGIPADADMEPGCAPHSRIGIWEPVHSGIRCRWCYDFQAIHRQDPPDDLLRMKAKGTRITQKMVDEALRGKKKARRRAP